LFERWAMPSDLAAAAASCRRDPGTPVLVRNLIAALFRAEEVP
jgi:hypothetical protein